MWEVQVGAFQLEEPMNNFIKRFEKDMFFKCEIKNASIPNMKAVVLETKFPTENEAKAVVNLIREHRYLCFARERR